MIEWISLAECLNRAIADQSDRILARSVFGTDDAKQIQGHLQQFCQTYLGCEIEQCSLSYFSVGATFVVQLLSGQQVVIKAYGADHDPVSLQTSFQVQAILAQTGFACPAVIALPQLLGSTTFTVQGYCEPGEPMDGFAPIVRQAMAQRLAELIERTRCLKRVVGLRPWMPWLVEDRSLWAKPHNALFNFEQTARGAEWIDAIAQEAKQILLQVKSEPVIGHSDWSLQNMAFRSGQVICVYDWDSLRVGPEPFFVGGAARCFAHDWRYGAPARAITIPEAQDFIQAYETARGNPFTASEQQAIGAALVYTAAYGTRCAHPGDAPETDHSQRTKIQLKEFAAHFLTPT